MVVTTKAKAWVAAVGTLITALSAALSDDVFDINDTTQVVVTLVSAAASVYAVYKVPNRTVGIGSE